MNFFSKGADLFLPQNHQMSHGDGLYSPFAGVDFIIIDQEEHWWEMVPCCNQEAKFNVYATNQNLQYNKYPKPPPLLATFTETSDYFARQCFRSCRKFQGTFRLGGQVLGKSLAPLKCHCPVSCMSCICDRPEIYVSDQSDQFIGSLKMPQYGPICCAIGTNTWPMLELEMYDNQGNIRFRIKGNCCQQSQLCYPFRFCGCEHVDYLIYDSNNVSTGGFIKNLLNECMVEVCTSADLYAVGFPPNCFPQDKLLLTHAAIWIDYLQFRG